MSRESELRHAARGVRLGGRDRSSALCLSGTCAPAPRPCPRTRRGRSSRSSARTGGRPTSCGSLTQCLPMELTDPAVSAHRADAGRRRQPGGCAELVLGRRARSGASPDERAEAAGGAGRAYKQMYVLKKAPGRPGAVPSKLALARYRTAYEQATYRPGWGSNVVALLACAGRDGIGLADYHDPVKSSRVLAAEILETVDRSPTRTPGTWRLPRRPMSP